MIFIVNISFTLTIYRRLRAKIGQLFYFYEKTF